MAALQLCWLTVSAVLLISTAARAANVSHDGRSLIIDGERRILISGSIHYPRSTPEMWPSLIAKAKQGGLDVVQTYVFWNLHEPQQGKYVFTGRADIVRFIREVQSQGLYVSLRMGPFIQSEWNYGGLPFWLHDIPGIVYRSDNEPFKKEMQKFITMMVNMLKTEKLYASQGGPIILSQIENEYKTVEAAFHERGPPYVQWAAKMSTGLQTGVPWVMCKQDDAPDPVINACNGLRCGETFVGPNAPNKPAIWTEDWTSNYQVYGAETIIRSPEDIAFHVLLFIIAKNGSFVNYYMYHGGTNYGRTSAHFMITGYYDQAPLDEYGLIRQPKYGHLQDLHAAIKSSSKALLSGTQIQSSLGKFQQAYVFRSAAGDCAAFLVNNDGKGEANVKFQNGAYKLPAKSISVLPDCKTEAFNTGKIKAEYLTSTRRTTTSIKFDSVGQWQEFKDDIVTFDKTTLKANSLLEHTGTTKDASDYLWYTVRIDRATPSTRAKLDINSRGHVLHAFVNGQHVGSQHGSKDVPRFTLQERVSLNKGTNYVSLLSATVGLPDSGPYMERRAYGVHTVNIDGSQFSNYSWGYQIGLLGEKLNIYTDYGSKQVKWSSYGGSSSQLLTWYKTVFDEPAGNDSVALNLGSMGKGVVWVNGHSIGRYWVSFHTPKGNPSQTWYHIPRSFLIPKGNQLIILEEEQGKPLGITLDIITTRKRAIRTLNSKHM